MAPLAFCISSARIRRRLFFLSIVWARFGFRFLSSKKSSSALLFSSSLLSFWVGPYFRVLGVVSYSVYIHSASSNNKRNARAIYNIRDFFKRYFLILGYAENFFWARDIKSVMRYAVHFFFVYLRGAYRYVFIYLAGVGADYFA